MDNSFSSLLGCAPQRCMLPQACGRHFCQDTTYDTDYGSGWEAVQLPPARHAQAVVTQHISGTRAPVCSQHGPAYPDLERRIVKAGQTCAGDPGLHGADSTYHAHYPPTTLQVRCCLSFCAQHAHYTRNSSTAKYLSHLSTMSISFANCVKVLLSSDAIIWSATVQRQKSQKCQPVSNVYGLSWCVSHSCCKLFPRACRCQTQQLIERLSVAAMPMRQNGTRQPPTEPTTQPHILAQSWQTQHMCLHTRLQSAALYRLATRAQALLDWVAKGAPVSTCSITQARSCRCGFRCQ